jgi:hypothetical protein
MITREGSAPLPSFTSNKLQTSAEITKFLFIMTLQRIYGLSSKEEELPNILWALLMNFCVELITFLHFIQVSGYNLSCTCTPWFQFVEITPSDLSNK